jgi:hypothetical protein
VTCTTVPNNVWSRWDSKVRRAMDHLPAALDGLNAELSDVACGLTAVLEDRRRTFFPLTTVCIF